MEVSRVSFEATLKTSDFFCDEITDDTCYAHFCKCD
jgi:hypothetical protein